MSAYGWIRTLAVVFFLGVFGQACLEPVDTNERLSAFEFEAPDTPLTPDPEWVRTARIGGLDVDWEMEPQEVVQLLRARYAQNVSVLELDSALSQYMTDAVFEQQATFLGSVAAMAHRFGMRAVAYYPSLEVLTEQGTTAEHTMYKDHPDWVQRGLDGEANVFYGSLEWWVEGTDESAWMCPNGPYREIYLNRIRRLAASDLDGVWVDVPLLMDHVTTWTCTNVHCDQAFNQWSVAHGHGGEQGFHIPSVADFGDPVFRTWLRWRHETLADFVEDVRVAAHEVDPNFWVIIETFPLDYLDATDKGLDGAFRRSSDHFTRVWEVDSVSNTKAMAWATPEDFTSKIAMYKWARAADRESPSWVFSYGYQPDDAGLVMAAAVATGNRPFETKTPIMTQTTDSDFRTSWFEFLRKEEASVGEAARHAQMGIWYSSASRDYLDMPFGDNGIYGMFVTTSPPNPDSTWWATAADDSVVHKPHIGGWRAAVHTLIQLKIPYRPILSPGDPEAEMAGLEGLWLPSVAAMSDEDAQRIIEFAEAGGIVLATGHFPATLDELGSPRDVSPLAALFGVEPGVPADDHVRVAGAGLAIFRKTLDGGEFFAENVGEEDARWGVSEVERLLRIHLDEAFVLDQDPWVMIESSRPSADRHVLYIVNFSGLQGPYREEVRSLKLGVRPGAGKRVVSARVVTPDEAGQNGAVTVTPVVPGLQELSLDVARFAVVEMELAPDGPSAGPLGYEGPKFASAAREQAAKNGLQFVRDRMRPTDLDPPWSYGVYTNLLEKENSPVERYAHGHLVTSEHMGLMLRAAACMGDSDAFQEAHSFVRDTMVSPTFQVLNWTIDPALKGPVLQQGEPGDPWRNGNAPLDDFRAIRGLIAGAAQVNDPAALALAKRLMRGLYWTSVTNAGYQAQLPLPAYPGGLVGYAWNFEETDGPGRELPAVARGVGDLDTDMIPIDYQDTWTMGAAATWDPRWSPVVASSVDLMLAAEIAIDGAPGGIYYNGLNGVTGQLTGDFENPESVAGKHLKTIQELWTALHLGRAAALPDTVLDAERRQKAGASAARSLAFFKAFHASHGRVPEYLTVAGADVPDCSEAPANVCLVHGLDNLFYGEARIYALLARLALTLGDEVFAGALIDTHILPDREVNPESPRYGSIGLSTADDQDAEAWNVLEAVLTLCLEAGGR